MKHKIFKRIGFKAAFGFLPLLLALTLLVTGCATAPETVTQTNESTATQTVTIPSATPKLVSAAVLDLQGTQPLLLTKDELICYQQTSAVTASDAASDYEFFALALSDGTRRSLGKTEQVKGGGDVLTAPDGNVYFVQSLAQKPVSLFCINVTDGGIESVYESASSRATQEICVLDESSLLIYEKDRSEDGTVTSVRVLRYSFSTKETTVLKTDEAIVSAFAYDGKIYALSRDKFKVYSLDEWNADGSLVRSVSPDLADALTDPGYSVLRMYVLGGVAWLRMSNGAVRPFSLTDGMYCGEMMQWYALYPNLSNPAAKDVLLYQTGNTKFRLDSWENGEIRVKSFELSEFGEEDFLHSVFLSEGGEKMLAVVWEGQRKANQKAVLYRLEGSI